MNQKKVFVITTLIIIFTLIFPIIVFAKVGVLNDSNVRVRSGPSTSGTDTLENLYKGDTVEILDKEGDWYKVKTESRKSRIYVC